MRGSDRWYETFYWPRYRTRATSAIPVELFSEKPTAMIFPSVWMRSADAPSSPWIVVVRVPPLPKLASRLPSALTRAAPIGDVPRKWAPATTIWPFGWTATAPALSLAFRSAGSAPGRSSRPPRCHRSEAGRRRWGQPGSGILRRSGPGSSGLCRLCRRWGRGCLRCLPLQRQRRRGPRQDRAPTCRSRQLEYVSSLSLSFLAFLIASRWLDRFRERPGLPPAVRGSGRRLGGPGNAPSRHRQRRPHPVLTTPASETPRGQQSALVTEHDPAPPPVHPGLPQQW